VLYECLIDFHLKLYISLSVTVVLIHMYSVHNKHGAQSQYIPRSRPCNLAIS